MTRTELLGSTTLTPAVVTAPGPNTLKVGADVWAMLCAGRDERRWMVFDNARRTGKTFAMQNVKLQVADEGGVYIDIERFSPVDPYLEGTMFHRAREAVIDADYSSVEERALAVLGFRPFQAAALAANMRFETAR